MTSPRFNARKAQAEAEMAAYDSLPSALRKAVDESQSSVAEFSKGQRRAGYFLAWRTRV